MDFDKESPSKKLSQTGLSYLGSPGQGFLQEIINFNKESSSRAHLERGLL